MAINCRDRASSPIVRKYFLLALALSAEAYRIFAFIVLAKAALEAATFPPPEGGGNLNSRRSSFLTRSLPQVVPSVAETSSKRSEPPAVAGG
jgi:hypothetical protein